jgi:hypothetical protein
MANEMSPADIAHAVFESVKRLLESERAPVSDQRIADDTAVPVEIVRIALLEGLVHFLKLSSSEDGSLKVVRVEHEPPKEWRTTV